jgi:hypothetical protein
MIIVTRHTHHRFDVPNHNASLSFLRQLTSLLAIHSPSDHRMPLHIADVVSLSFQDIKEEFIIFFSSIVDGRLWCPVRQWSLTGILSRMTFVYRTVLPLTALSKTRSIRQMVHRD